MLVCILSSIVNKLSKKPRVILQNYNNITLLKFCVVSDLCPKERERDSFNGITVVVFLLLLLGFRSIKYTEHDGK